MNQVTETTAKTNLPSTYVDQGPEVLKSDIILPYVLLAQGMSDAVQERKVQLGDIYRSTTTEKLGDPEHPLEVILLNYPKSDWVIEQKTGSKFEYRGTMPRTAKNEDIPWSYFADHEGVEVPEGSKGATEWRRVKRMMVYALLPRDVLAHHEELKKVEAGDLPDPNKALTPVILSFRSSSYKAGKECANLFIKARTMKTPVWRYQATLSNYLDKNDDGTFYVWKLDAAVKAVPKELLTMVEEWVSIVNSGTQLKADDQADTQNTGSGPRDVQPAEEI